MPNSEKKICQNCKTEFIIDASDFEFYEKIKVPPPTWCPECREQRRLAFRNERSLYKRKCDLCEREVVSRVSPDKPYPMYCQKCWWSDKWEPLSYGRDYNFKKPFFEQFKELFFSIPHIGILNVNVVNSDWVNQESDDKNCYLNVGGRFNQDSAYNTYEIEGKDCFDNFWISKNEFCYENISCERCYRTFFSQNCFNCLDTFFSYDCRNCQNIFGCAGLRNKQYYVFNKPYSKEEYQRFLKENPLSSYKNLLTLKEKTKKIWMSVPHRASYILHSINSWGNFITYSKNAKNCWFAHKIEDSKNLYIAASLKDCYDCSSYGWGELCYEVAHSSGLYNSKFCFGMIGDPTTEKISSSNLEYCASTIGSHNCFGCVGLKHQEYCILNKKYSKTEYEELIPKIKKQMEEIPYIDQKDRIYKYGEFFPIELSPFGYNETTAQDYYPLTKKECLEKGYLWSDYESKIKYEFSEYQIPDDISEVKDDILDKVLKCEISGRPYKIIPMELQFYRKAGLPIPRKTPLQRHKERISLLISRKLYKRNCQKCSNEILTIYSPERPEIVYCEKCYQQEVM